MLWFRYSIQLAARRIFFFPSAHLYLHLHSIPRPVKRSTLYSAYQDLALILRPRGLAPSSEAPRALRQLTQHYQEARAAVIAHAQVRPLQRDRAAIMRTACPMIPTELQTRLVVEINTYESAKVMKHPAQQWRSFRNIIKIHEEVQNFLKQKGDLAYGHWRRSSAGERREWSASLSDIWRIKEWIDRKKSLERDLRNQAAAAKAQARADAFWLRLCVYVFVQVYVFCLFALEGQGGAEKKMYRRYTLPCSIKNMFGNNALLDHL